MNTYGLPHSFILLFNYESFFSFAANDGGIYMPKSKLPSNLD